MPVPSNSTRVGSFWDLNLKKTEDVIVANVGYPLEQKKNYTALLGLDGLVIVSSPKSHTQGAQAKRKLWIR